MQLLQHFLFFCAATVTVGSHSGKPVIPAHIQKLQVNMPVLQLAQFRHGVCTGLPVILCDKDAAYRWFRSAASQGHTYAQFFVDRMEQQVYASPGLLLSATRLLHHMGRIFRENVPPVPVPDGMQIERKRLHKLREKKIALGHKPDDREEEQRTGSMTMGGW